MKNGRRNPVSRHALAAAILIMGVVSTGGAAGMFQQGPGQPTQSGEQVRPPTEPGATEILVAPDTDYRIGARDVIEVQVQDASELSGTFAISATGTFLMPYLGFVTALDKTPEEVGRYIAENLRGRYLKEPRVSVTVKQYNSRSFFIQGAVRSPGVYKIEGRASLLKLIILAGGLAENHGSTAFIIRQPATPAREEASKPPASTNGHAETTAALERPSADTQPPDEEYELLKVNINGLLKGHFDQNVIIEPGDVINIPRSDVFFVAGEVEAPGSFPLKEGTTLRQAISLARGLTFEAAKSRGLIFRELTETGKREEIHVDVGAVMSGKQDDIAILANDIIMIPNSRFKSVSGTLLRAFGMGAVRSTGVRF